MVVSVIGTGLIGGSMALDLKANGFAEKVIGVDASKTHLDEALTLNLVDVVLPLKEAVRQAGLIIIAVPVNVAPIVLGEVLDEINPEAVVMDVGSTKENMCYVGSRYHNRDQFVAAHPIAGTENTGPHAAHKGLFEGKINIICERNKSSKKALEIVDDLFHYLKMKSIDMDPKEHDKHIAYVSHLSHISSFTLGLTVLDIEKDEKNIFNMAGSGFASTVRLAKSSPTMWAPIFEQNAQNISVALGEYIDKLTHFKKLIEEGNKEEAYQLMSKANQIKRVLEGIELNNHIISNTNNLEKNG